MRYEAVIFDLDGTLTDTLDGLRASVNYALAACGMPLRTREEIRRFVGNGVKKLVERSVPAGTDPAETARCFAEFRQHYERTACDQTKVYAGVAAVLAALQAAGIRCAVVTNKMDAAAQKITRDFFGGTVDLTVGQREGLALKPAPDGVRLALQALGVARERAVYVGDSEVDCQTANNAGLPCIGVAWGFRGRKVLEENGADAIAETPAELQALLLAE